MMEHTTDRLFWTLTSIIVGALILTISIKAFPAIAENIMNPISQIENNAGTTASTANNAANQATNQISSDTWNINLPTSPSNQNTNQ